MLGAFSLLPLLKGWDYKERSNTRTLTRGQTIEVDRMSNTGWIIQIVVLSTDLYGGGRFKYQGSDLELHEFTLDASVSKTLGAIAQDPSGWTQLAYQPNPYSTQGVYCSGLTPGWQGSPMPFVPTTIMEVYLADNSTEATATVMLYTLSIEITDKVAFMKSLRAVIGMPTIQEIDSALLSVGPGEITAKGSSEKEKS